MKRLPVPGPDDRISIFTLAILDDASVRDRVEKILARRPALRRIYDPQFLDRLVPDRQNLDNYLLLLLANTEDGAADQFWSEVSRDLLVLEGAGAFEVFARKLRQTGAVELHSAKTELELTAWIQRRGHAVTPEPMNPETGRKCDFSAASAPPTFWEVKSVLDQPYVREQQRAQAEVRKHLRYIDEPYILHIDFGELSRAGIVASAKSIRGKIRNFHHAGGQPLPITSSKPGFKVTVAERSPREYGYLGSSTWGYSLGREDVRHVLDRTSDAVAQIPNGGAGIVVIDTTMADHVEEEDVEDACYGEPTGLAVVGGGLVMARSREVLFRPDTKTRISAVMYYDRRNTGDRLEVTKRVFHNPFAENPLPPGLLSDVKVTEVRLRAGSYRLA